MAFPDYPMGTDIHRWTSSADMGLQHVARITHSGVPTYRMACSTVADKEPSTAPSQLNGKPGCGFCLEWMVRYPDVRVVDYAA